MKTQQKLSFEEALTQFIRSLAGQNKSVHTARAYETDITQFLSWVRSIDITVTFPDQVTRSHITDYLSHLSDQGRTGVTRARKLASLREFFKFLMASQVIEHSPAATISMPKKERKSRVYLRPEEYNKMLAAAGSNTRDFCLLQLFLQTGIRVSELVNLTLSDVDVAARTITISGKGKKERVIDLEKKGIQAIKAYLAVRPNVLDTHLFLNYEGKTLSVRGVMKIVEKYVRLAGISKKVSCHSLRHTFGTLKAEQGVSPFQLQAWMGHESISTTQLYVHISRANSQKVMEQTSL
jgi:site-specific recombinase XerD